MPPRLQRRDGPAGRPAIGIGKGHEERRARLALGRAFARRHASGLALSPDPRDWDDGEVRLRRDVHLFGLPDVEIIGDWFATTCLLVDGFYPALINIVYRGMQPSQALEQGEADFEKLVRETEE